MNRDLVALMRDVIDEATGTGPYISRVVAADIVAKLRANDPDLLAGWLDLRAEELVWKEINDRDRSVRATARAHAGRINFRQAADDAAGGDSTSLHRLLDMPFVVATTGERKPLGKMTGPECRFVAVRYEQSARRARMHAVLLRALEKEVGTDTVEEHFTEDQLGVLWQTFGFEST